MYKLIHNQTLLSVRKDFMRESSNREVTDKPKSAGHFTNSAADTMLSIEIVQATKRGLTREMTERDKGQQVSFESSAHQITHEMDENSVGPQSLHVPHLRATDDKFPSACDATVDLEAPSVPQVAHSVESLRV